MKYFLDTEFIECFSQPLFRPKRHFIDLISIGIYCEDGREFHAISNEYRFKDADDWVQQNVIAPLYIDTVHGDNRNRYGVNTFHKAYGYSNANIAEDVLKFLGCWRDQHFYRAPEGIEVYGYYSDYDWVLFCSLFGRMIDLPNGFPMYCKDLKQSLDERAENIDQLEMTKHVIGEGGKWNVISPVSKSVINIDDYSLSMKLELLKSHKDYPKQTNEHHALADAKWNYDLYKFLQ